MDELVEEVLLRLPPDDPASLFRASAVCKPWRIILAGPRFRRRYREFHGTPPILGLFQQGGRFVPASALVPAHPGLPSWVAMDCRHGRALFAHLGITLELVVLDPVTGHQHRVTSSYHYPVTVGAAVLCAAQGCDHHGCQGGHFHLAFVSTDQVGTISAWLYSSETAEWSALLQHGLHCGVPTWYTPHINVQEADRRQGVSHDGGRRHAGICCRGGCRKSNPLVNGDRTRGSHWMGETQGN
ncbi:unnamed protein product [Triticum turgidum subsp. durum]|uniref:F-box domain-containing protein n=1 Tax=Triticum turgidum subsp. durum TaxID=4567 RepID=A0A9R0XKP1_TRITD|nr:unnamed protein product [Triticum turgidum subsp. durum]